MSSALHAVGSVDARVAELLQEFSAEERRRLWTVEEVKRVLNVSRWTIARAVSRGELACVKLGGALRYRLADVLRFTVLHEDGR